jgi:hypothetical protein
LLGVGFLGRGRGDAQQPRTAQNHDRAGWGVLDCGEGGDTIMGLVKGGGWGELCWGCRGVGGWTFDGRL